MSDDLDPEDFLKGPLFRPASSGLTVHLETYSPSWRAGAQAYGYQEAAETLIKVIIDGHYPTSRTLLHPLLFLYRHALELRLKRLIAEYGSGPAPLGHKLIDLWRTCRLIIEPYFDGDDLEKAERIIAELHAVDPNSHTFRYATLPKGDPIEISFGSVDLVHFREQMDHLDTFFFAVENTIDQSREYLQR